MEDTYADAISTYDEVLQQRVCWVSLTAAGSRFYSLSALQSHNCTGYVSDVDWQFINYDLKEDNLYESTGPILGSVRELYEELRRYFQGQVQSPPAP